MSRTRNLRAAFARQSQACAALGSPFMAHLMALWAERITPDGPIRSRLCDWPGDVGPGGASLPLRLAGALHALVLRGDPLSAVWPPHEAEDDQLWAACEDALTREETFIQSFLDSPPQTNEVRRAAPLIAMGHWLTERFGRPLHLTEVGPSAGLNLLWDRYALLAGHRRYGPSDSALTLTPDWSGSLPPQSAPQIASRQGVDLNPLDAADPATALRLRAYLWADQPERMQLTEAALREVTRLRPTLHRADAAEWLSTWAVAPPPDGLRLLFSTIAWQYLPEAAQAQARARIEAAGAEATDARPLAWFTMEADGPTGPGAALTLRLWPGDLTFRMGRADFHGRWIDWRNAGDWTA